MKRRCAVALVVLLALALTACGKASHTEAARAEPAKVEKVQGSDVNRVVLTNQAVQRLGIVTAPVRDLTPPVPGRTVVDLARLLAFESAVVAAGVDGNAIQSLSPWSPW